VAGLESRLVRVKKVKDSSLESFGKKIIFAACVAWLWCGVRLSRSSRGNAGGDRLERLH